MTTAVRVMPSPRLPKAPAPRHTKPSETGIRSPLPFRRAGALHRHQRMSRSLKALSVIVPTMIPGATAFTVTPREAISIASDFTAPCSPALAAALFAAAIPHDPGNRGHGDYPPAPRRSIGSSSRLGYVEEAVQRNGYHPGPLGLLIPAMGIGINSSAMHEYLISPGSRLSTEPAAEWLVTSNETNSASPPPAAISPAKARAARARGSVRAR